MRSTSIPPSKFLHPVNLSFFSRLNSQDNFPPIFFFLYRQEDVFVLRPSQCIFHSRSCYIDLHKVLTPLQVPNLSCCRWKPLHTLVWDTVLHTSLNETTICGFFSLRNQLVSQIFVPSFSFWSWKALRDLHTYATTRIENTVQAQGRENWGLLRFIYLWQLDSHQQETGVAQGSRHCTENP